MASIKRNDLTLGKELGSGGFGTVFSGIWKTENKVVAVKKLNKVDFQEINILKQLEHPNIVTLYGFVHEETDLMIVMELCEIGSLRSFLEQRVANPLLPSLIHDWMLQAALPIDHLRNHKIEHMDIKTDNYVITSRMVLKLTDFGLSQTLEKTRSYSSGDGSWRWMPPERLRDLKLSPKFSIYALALVFWCLFTQALPYAKYPSEFTIAKAVCDEKVRPPPPPTCPKPIWELIEACWHDDRSRRPDIKDVIIAIILHKSAFDSSVKHVEPQSTSPALKTSVTQTKIGKYSDASTQTVSESCTTKDDVVNNFAGSNPTPPEQHIYEELPERTVSEENLLQVAEKVGMKWKLMARNLGFKTNEIIEIEKEARNSANQCYCMLQHWKDKLSPSNSGHTDLVFALEKCGHRDLVAKLWSHSGDSPSGSEHFDPSTKPRDFGGFKSPTLKGYIHPPRTLSPEFVGRKKGIQGYQNSTYLDTTLFSMYAYSNIFDDILHRNKSTKDLQEYETVQTMLREDIVNPLRGYGFVRADRVLKLREYLDQLGTTKGLISEEQDPEKFLHTFLQEVTKTEPFLHIRQQGGKHVEKSYHYQIFMEKNESYQLPSVEQLLHYSFLHSNLQLAKVPPCLIIRMPIFGKDCIYNRILPSLYLDISDLLKGWPRICSVCGKLAELECRDCSGKIAETGIVEAINSYCQDCSNTIHVHSHRKNHKVKAVELSDEILARYTQAKENGMMEQEIFEKVFAPRKLMELFAVVCIETSHYVAFVKAGSGAGSQWVFFDSMAEREGDKQGYNIPEITHLREFQSWLENQTALKETNDKDLPPRLRRLLCDSYMCMYQDPDVVKQHQKQFRQRTPIESLM